MFRSLKKLLLNFYFIDSTSFKNLLNFQYNFVLVIKIKNFLLTLDYKF